MLEKGSSLESAPCICHDTWSAPYPRVSGQSMTLCTLLKCAETFFSKTLLSSKFKISTVMSTNTVKTTQPQK